MTQTVSKDGYLYSDCYEGILKLLMVLVPIAIGWFYKYLNNDFQGFVISFTISIVNQFYSARTSYKDASIITKRIKIENMIIILLLAVAFVITLFKWIPSMNNTTLGVQSFKIPVILFSISLLPNVFESFLTFFGKDLGISLHFKKKSNKNKSTQRIDLTCANRN